MKKLPYQTALLRWSAALTIGASATVALAAPYATCLSNNPVGTISFRLNAPANAVRIIYDSGASSTNLGPLPKGLTVTNLGITGVFSVEVTHNSGRGWLQGITNQVSADTNILMRFVNQRGVVVNKNPASPYFGRIYVGHAAQGTNAASGRVVRTGIYVINPDQTDALGQQIDTTNTVARTGGLVFSGTEGPHHLTIGPDDSLYIADWSDTFGSLYTTDANVATNAAAVDVLGGPVGSPFPVTAARSHGSINASFVTGSLATSDLTVYVIDEDLQNDKVTTTQTMRNSIWKWQIDAGPLPATSVTPSVLVQFNGIPTATGIGGASQLSDFTMGPGQLIYHTQRRAEPAGTAGLMVRSADGSTKVWDSITTTRTLLGNNAATDILGESVAVDVTPPGAGIQAQFVAVLKINTNAINFLPLDPNNGIPDLTNRITVGTVPTTASGRDIGFDAAGNIYSVSSGQGLLRIYSPGGTTVATTGSDGTFSITNLLPGVALSVAQPVIPEDGTADTFTVTRTGDNSADLTVYLAVSGTAANGVDYTTLPASVVIPATQSSVDIAVASIGDAIAESTESMTLSVVDNTNYFVLGRTSRVLITDTNDAVLTLSGISATMYERITNDYATVTIARALGNTNVTVTLADPGVFTFAGTAVMDVDYVVNSNLFPISFNPGDRAISVRLISPLDNSLLDGSRTVTIGLVSGVDYAAATNKVTTTIIDDEVPPETVLWSDNFNLADSATNYVQKFGSQNSLDDYSVTFAYDYTANYGVPPAPHSSVDNPNGLGLVMNVNKDGVLAAAGLNLYPTNASFSGNFALRFDMYLFNGTVSSTEYSIFGINHDGTKTNWFRASGNGYTNSSYDGLRFVVESDASGTDDYLLQTAPVVANGVVLGPTIRARSGAGAFAQVFKSPPYSFGAVSGSPANLNAPVFPQVPTWAEVEVAQVSNVVSLRINKTLVLSYTNAGASATSGRIMLGYDDAFDSIGNSQGIIYDNARVVQLVPPTILTQPTSATTPLGGATNFSVVASGSTTGFTNYQWRLNGIAIPGATSATLSFGSVQLTNYGTYTVIVSDGVYSVSSVAVTLLPPVPTILTPPSPLAAPVGGTASFSVVATTSTGTTNYQWTLNGTNVAGANYLGATTANLSIIPVQITNFGPYRVRVSDGFTTVTSILASLTVAIQPTITNSLSGSTLNLTFPTEIGPQYVVEWKGELTNGAWNPLSTNAGTGNPITVPDSTLTGAQRFYRVRMQ